MNTLVLKDVLKIASGCPGKGDQCRGGLQGVSSLIYLCVGAAAGHHTSIVFALRRQSGSCLGG